MKLFLNLSSGAVQNEAGELQYRVKNFEADGKMSVFDEFGVSELVTVHKNDNCFSLTAFDVPVGTLKPTESGFKTADETIAINAENEIYKVAFSEGTAYFKVEGENVVLALQTTDRAVLIIGIAAAVGYSEYLDTAADDVVEVEKAVKHHTKSKAYDAAAAAFESIAGSIKGANVKAKRNIICLAVAFLGMLLVFTGVFLSVKEHNTVENLKKTVGAVKITDNKATVAFTVGRYRYVVPTSAENRYNATATDVYYITDDNGRVTDYRFSAEASKSGIYIAVGGAVMLLGGLGVLLCSVAFAGKPRKKRQNVQRRVKEKAPQQSSYTRIIDETELSDIPLFSEADENNKEN